MTPRKPPTPDAPPSVAERIRALVKMNPAITTHEAAGILGLPARQVSPALSTARRHPEQGTIGRAGPRRRATSEAPRRTLPLVPGFMTRGRGDRREDCQRYTDCLRAFSVASSADGKCPKACGSFAAVDRTGEVWCAAALRPGMSALAQAEQEALGGVW